MIPQFYQDHLQSQLNPAEYLLVRYIIQILQSIKLLVLKNWPMHSLFQSYLTADERRFNDY